MYVSFQYVGGLMMEYISMQLAERMCKSNVINEDDKKYYAYSIQLLLE